MSTTHPAQQSDPMDLRARAQSKLEGGAASRSVAISATSAHRVLFDLASSPDTAADALALLHELQVHQVELDLQAEELRAASAELESALARQTLLYEHAPVALLTINPDTRLVELNRAAARHLGQDGEALLGKRLDSFLHPQGVASLQTLLQALGQGQASARSTLTLVGAGTLPRTMHASATIDPEGGRFLLALTDADTAA